MNDTPDKAAQDNALAALGIMQLNGTITTDQHACKAIMDRRDDVTGEREKDAVGIEVSCRMTAYVGADCPLITLMERLPEIANDQTIEADMRMLLHVLAAGLRKRMGEYEKQQETAQTAEAPKTDTDDG